MSIVPPQAWQIHSVAMKANRKGPSTAVGHTAGSTQHRAALVGPAIQGQAPSNRRKALRKWAASDNKISRCCKRKPSTCRLEFFGSEKNLRTSNQHQEQPGEQRRSEHVVIVNQGSPFGRMSPASSVSGTGMIENRSHSLSWPSLSEAPVHQKAPKQSTTVRTAGSGTTHCDIKIKRPKIRVVNMEERVAARRSNRGDWAGSSDTK